jgi:5-methylcytosine-specific restriction endonuclease McrA
MEKNCQVCDKLFSKPAYCSKNAWVDRKLCSKECYLNWKPKVTKVCLECSGHFTVKNYRKDTANFCSPQCSWQYRDEGKRTANKKIRQSWAYKAWRTLVFERDNYTCTECGDKNYDGRGKSLALHADHIKPFALYPELRFEPSNGRTLCVPCHKKTGTYGRGAIYRKQCIASA